MSRYTTYDELRDRVEHLEKELDYYKSLLAIVQGTNGELEIGTIRKWIKEK